MWLGRIFVEFINLGKEEDIEAEAEDCILTSSKKDEQAEKADEDQAFL